MLKTAAVLLLIAVVHLTGTQKVLAAQGMNEDKDIVTSREEFLYETALRLTRRTENIIIYADFSLTEHDLNNVINKAKKKRLKGRPASGDYCRENILYMRVDKCQINSGVWCYSMQVKYRESLDEMKYVKERCRKILKSVRGKPTYDKLVYIINWIAHHVERSEGYQYTSAYEALKYGKGNCMGYALLFQRLAAGVGIPCWTVRGYVKAYNTPEDPTGGYHIWNIVKIQGKKYYADASWYDVVDGYVSREYFLFGSILCNRERTIEQGYRKRISNISKKRYKKKK